MCELDGKQNYAITQVWNFDKNYQLVDSKKPSQSSSLELSNKFKLRFQYACRKNVDLNSCKGEVVWNGKVYEINPVNYDVNNYKLEVSVKKG